MKFFRHTGQYYLKKIKDGQLTNQQVAEILNTTLEIVDSAYDEYCKDQNPFKKKSFEFKSTAIQIAISAISTCLVLFTLFEMQAARNATYLPNIFISNTEVAISWDKDGRPYIGEEDLETISKMIDEHTIINKLPQMKAYNIGVGTAKDITFKWDTSNNIQQLANVLNACDNVNVIFDGSFVNIKVPLIEQGMWASDSSQNDQIGFLLNSSQESATLSFPLPYYELIRQICIRADEKRIPPLHLQISFSDIQSRTYTQFLQINSTISLLLQNPDGSGFCVFNLISAKESKAMDLMNIFHANTDVLIAITSICAVIISIVSMIFTVIFSMFQLRHNKNSVKPISEIKLSDYEDKLAVKIENVGTGPLTVKKLVFKNGNKESPTLVSLMPQINQFWNTFTESIDGWTIPVGGQLILLELCPENDETKELIRKTLSNITAYLEYTDIYGTKFQNQKSFDFFGRHFI